MKSYFLTAIIVGLFANSAYAQDAYMKGSNNYGCIHKADFDKTTEYMVQNDRKAFTQFLGLGVSTGVCTLFDTNEPVIITKFGLMTSKVRRRGDLKEYYVDSSFIGK